MSQAQPAGTIVWKDLTVENADVIRDFYAEVVGWKHSPCDMGGYDDYNMTPPGSNDPVAGICHARGANANLPAQWLIYVAVEDVDSSIRRCIELGGHLVDGPRKMGSNRFCVVKDPVGAVLGLISK
ncbi:MAG: VOC family protein [Acidobacteria bacterium]|nr:MAG: VOC family protein [Acidobacteriota bacterium]